MATRLTHGWYKWNNFYVSNPHTHKCIARIQKNEPTIQYETFTSTGLDKTDVTTKEVVNVAFGAKLTLLAGTKNLRVLPEGMQAFCDEINSSWKRSYHTYKVKVHAKPNLYKVVESDKDPVIGVVIQALLETGKSPIRVYVHRELAKRLKLSDFEHACVVYSVHAPHSALQKYSCSGEYLNDLTEAERRCLSPELVTFLELLRSATLNNWGPSMLLPKDLEIDPQHLWHPKITLDSIVDESALIINGRQTHVKKKMHGKSISESQTTSTTTRGFGFSETIILSRNVTC